MSDDILRTLKVGDRVDATIHGAIVQDINNGTVTLATQVPGKETKTTRLVTVRPGELDITLTLLPPAEWPPQVGDLWQMTEGSDRWFAHRWYAEFDDPQDAEGINEDGWRIVLTPLRGGPYGQLSGRPDFVWQQVGGLRLISRADTGTDGGDLA